MTGLRCSNQELPPFNHTLTLYLQVRISTSKAISMCDARPEAHSILSDFPHIGVVKKCWLEELKSTSFSTQFLRLNFLWRTLSDSQSTYESRDKLRRPVCMPFGNLAVATQHASRDSCEVHILTFYSTHSKPIHFRRWHLGTWDINL